MIFPITIPIVGSITDLRDALNKAGSIVRQFNTKFSRNVLSFLGISTAFDNIGTQLRKLAVLFFEQERQELRLEGVLRATGHAAGFTADQLKTYASRLQEITTVGDETIIGIEALIATFRNIRGDEFLDTVKAAIDMAEIFGSVESSALALAKALNDPIRGLNSLNRRGVQFSTQQREVIKALAETGDVAGAQRVILDELNSQVGDLGNKMANSFTGQALQLKNAFGDLGEEIARLLVPALTVLIKVGESVISVLSGIVGILNNLQDQVVEVAKNLRDTFKDIFSLEGLFGPLPDVIKNQMEKGIKDGLDAASNALEQPFNISAKLKVDKTVFTDLFELSKKITEGTGGPSTDEKNLKMIADNSSKQVNELRGLRKEEKDRGQELIDALKEGKGPRVLI